MAEAVGLAVGLIGLAGLFTTCVDCFKLVQVYSAKSDDFELLQTMLDNQQFHFMAWGKACGFMDPDRAKSVFDDPSCASRNRRIADTMEKIIALLGDGEGLKKKYGMKPYRPPIGAKLLEGASISAFAKAFRNTKSFYSTSLQRTAQITGTMRWSIDDKDKFDKLVQNLRDLLSDLSRFTEDIGVKDRQSLIVEYEVETIDDEPSLEAITAASAADDDDDLISSIASRKLSRVKAQSMANQSVKFDDSVSMASFAGYTPSVSTLVEEEDGEGVVQPIEVMRVSITQWRKIKTRAGVMSWLPVLVIATTAPSDLVELEDGIRGLSRADTFGDHDIAPATGKATRVAINSNVLISILRRVTGSRFSSKQNVLVHPFKPLIVFEEELRSYHAQLQDKTRNLESFKAASIHGMDDVGEAEPALDTKNHNEKLMQLDRATRMTEELKCLLDFIDSDLSQLLRMYRNPSSISSVSFENLWLLFQPGALVVSTGDLISSLRDRAYQVLHTVGGRKIIDVDNNSGADTSVEPVDQGYDGYDGYALMASREASDFVIDCFFIDFNGDLYGPRSKKFVIPEFEGERHLHSFPIYPLSSATSSMALRAMLLERGKRFVSSMERRRYHYSGPALQDWDLGHKSTCAFCARSSFQPQINNEIVVDHITALEQCRSVNCDWSPSFGGGIIAKATKGSIQEVFETVDCSKPNCKTCTDVFNDTVIDLRLRDRFLRSSANLRNTHPRDIHEGQMLLLPYRVCDYSLNHRKCFPLDVSLLQEVDDPVESFERIVIPAEQKAMLRSLIENHAQDQDGDAPHAARNRGGVVVLLHGAPGTGKNLTARAVAAYLRRSVLPVRVADLGDTAETIEQRFASFVNLAGRWGSILLMRDADVLLVQRSRDDRMGNIIAAAFLTALEVFTGVLILTTNRVGVLDEAFKSRIHLVLHFTQFDADATLQIWHQMLERLLAEDRNLEIEQQGIPNFVRKSWETNKPEHRLNGREINNLIANALALAREDAKHQAAKHEDPDRAPRVRLQVSHIKAAAKSGRNFNSYMETLHGHDSMSKTQRAAFEIPLPRPSQQFRARKARNREDSSDSEKWVSGAEGDDLELQELELQLKIAKLKRQQKKKQRFRQQYLPEGSVIAAIGGASKKSIRSRVIDDDEDDEVDDDYDDSE